ncbi:MAG: hypothetical protein LUG50_05005 [Planctomycetaceae bacterium]|nr:hypothetical protein [Planctomycetaceae bacterium]
MKIALRDGEWRSVASPYRVRPEAASRLARLLATLQPEDYASPDSQAIRAGYGGPMVEVILATGDVHQYRLAGRHPLFSWRYVTVDGKNIFSVSDEEAGVMFPGFADILDLGRVFPTFDLDHLVAVDLRNADGDLIRFDRVDADTWSAESESGRVELGREGDKLMGELLDWSVAGFYDPARLPENPELVYHLRLVDTSGAEKTVTFLPALERDIPFILENGRGFVIDRSDFFNWLAEIREIRKHIESGAARLEAERAEAERAEAERLEAERIDAERLENERLKAERREAERQEIQQVTAEEPETEGFDTDQTGTDQADTAESETAPAGGEQGEAGDVDAEVGPAESVTVDSADAGTDGVATDEDDEGTEPLADAVGAEPAEDSDADTPATGGDNAKGAAVEADDASPADVDTPVSAETLLPGESVDDLLESIAAEVVLEETDGVDAPSDEAIDGGETHGQATPALDESDAADPNHLPPAVDSSVVEDGRDDAAPGAEEEDAPAEAVPADESPIRDEAGLTAANNEPVDGSVPAENDAEPVAAEE